MSGFFIGAMVPDAIRAELCASAPDIAGARWVKPDKYHLTFKYFADLSEELSPGVHNMVRELDKHFPLECCAYSYSGFPSSSKARVIVVLLKLFNDNLGQVCGNHRFNPHITVGYARSDRVQVPNKSLNLRFSFDRPALFQSLDGVYTDVGVPSKLGHSR